MFGSACITFAVEMSFTMGAVLAVLQSLTTATVFLGACLCRPLAHWRFANVISRILKNNMISSVFAIWLNSVFLFFYIDLCIIGSKTACLKNESNIFDRCCSAPEWKSLKTCSVAPSPPSSEGSAVYAGSWACHYTTGKWMAISRMHDYFSYQWSVMGLSFWRHFRRKLPIPIKEKTLLRWYYQRK